MTTHGKLWPLFTCFLLAYPMAHAAGKGRILLLALEHPDALLIRKEVKPMMERLQQAGFTVVIASEHAAPIGSGETLLRPDLPFSQVVISRYVGVVVPCMESAKAQDNLPIPQPVLKILKAAAARKLPIAAQDLGVTALGMAGLLRGRAYAADADRPDPTFGGSFKGRGVVTDGRVVTSGECPAVSATPGTHELMTQFLRLLPLS